MEIKMRKVIDGQQGYWSVIELEHTEEEFIGPSSIRTGADK